MKLDSIDGPYPWKAPKLTKPADNNLLGQWCVTYYVWSFDLNDLKRKRVIVTGESVDERMLKAKLVMDEINDYCRDGRVYVGNKPDRPALPPPVPTAPAPERRVIARLPIRQAVEEYIAFSKAAFSPNTFKTYRAAVMHLNAYIERHRRSHLTLGEFQPADAIEFLHELITVEGLGNRSRNNTKNFVCTFFNHFIDLDRTRKLRQIGNPFADIGLMPYVKNKHQAYSLRQQEEYRNVCAELNLDYLLTFSRWQYYTLMRPHEELRRLRIRDIRTYTIYVPGETAKSNSGDYIDIPLPLEQIIQSQSLRNFPDHYYVFSKNGVPGPDLVGPKYFYRRHQQVIEKMNLTGTGHDMYAWKHTGAIALWNATNDIELIRRQARHKDIKDTINYLRDLGVRLSTDDKIHKFPVF